MAHKLHPSTWPLPRKEPDIDKILSDLRRAGLHPDPGNFIDVRVRPGVDTALWEMIVLPWRTAHCRGLTLPDSDLWGASQDRLYPAKQCVEEMLAETECKPRWIMMSADMYGEALDVFKNTP